MNNKGEVTISGIVISSIMFMMFLTAGLFVTESFFNENANSINSSYNSSYFNELQSSRIDEGSDASLFVSETTGMSDDVFQTNGSVGESSGEDIMNKNTLKSLTRLPYIYNFVKDAGRDISDKIKIPPFFLYGFTLIVVVIIVFGTMKALRGIR